MLDRGRLSSFICFRRPFKLRVGSWATYYIFTSFQAERHSTPFRAARKNQLTSLRNVKQEFKGKVSGVKVDAVHTTGTGDALLNILASDMDLCKAMDFISSNRIYVHTVRLKRDVYI
jgi:hypothetical protein